MATHFTLKLPGGHGVNLLSQQAATAVLRADALVAPAFSYQGTVPEMRELCAALHWVRSPNYTPAAVRQLPPVVLATLCRLLSVPVLPNGAPGGIVSLKA